jgi:hypothetical protein
VPLLRFASPLVLALPLVVADISVPAAKAPAPPPPQQGRSAMHACTAVGCTSSVSIHAHLDASPEALAAAGTFTACLQEECWDGTVTRPAPGRSRGYRCASEKPGPLQAFCDVEAEGSGATLELTLGAFEQRTFRDGDRVSLRVRVAGKKILDHVRYVKYADNHPNGRDCPGYCQNATVEIWPSSPSGKTCASARCEPYVRFERTVPMTEQGAGMTTVTACRNGTCRTSRLQLWRWQDGHGEPVRAGNAGVGDDIDRYSPMVDFGPNGQGGYDLRVTFRGDTRDFQRGDHYSVEWRALESGQLLMKSDERVTDYEESYPGGRECTPVPCRQKTFRL